MFFALYRTVGRTRDKAFSLLARRAFAAYGARSVIQPPIRLWGERRISIGSNVFVGAGSWLQALDPEGDGLAIVLGDGTSISGSCVLSAARSIVIGRDVLMARNVYIADHSHAFDDIATPIIKQGVDRIAPVHVGEGSWLGQSVVVGPGVRIGRGAVVGANSVVLEDVPDYCVAVGAPARVVRSLTPGDSSSRPG